MKQLECIEVLFKVDYHGFYENVDKICSKRFETYTLVKNKGQKWKPLTLT